MNEFIKRIVPADRLSGERPWATRIDWILFLAFFLIVCAGLVTMNSFVGDNSFFERQIMWAPISIIFFFLISFIDFRFLRRTEVVVTLLIVIVTFLLALLALGITVKGAQSWFNFGGISFEPADLAKIILVILLAKYFSRRHIEIANVRHILVSGAYSFILFALIVLQPDFGSAIIIFCIWLGMVLVSGISKKHLLVVFLGAIIIFGVLWNFGFKDYQKQRIMTFIHPLSDIRGVGYNVWQSTIAFGSGELWGKGIGYGTQSKLKFLPEYQTDFIFAAFAEEWGFFGVIILFGLYGVVIWRILVNSFHGATNFEILFGLGVATYIASHFIIHVGMNIGLLPVTGIPLPFMSYGGTHLLMESTALGILMGMRGYAKTAHKDLVHNEFIGPV